MSATLRAMVRRILPLSFRRSLSDVVVRATRWPPLGKVDFGSLGGLSPVSRDWGFDRGQPVDRYLIERFLAREAGRIQGRVLEIDTPEYTRKFGGERVTESDVLHISEMGPGITLVGDLVDGTGLPSDAFDCVILTQTLQLIYDTRSALETVHRMLRPGGTALVTVPGMSPMTKDPDGKWGYFWGFTTLSAERLFRECFPGGSLQVEAWGSVLTATAFLQGLAADELTTEQLLHRDPQFEVLVTVRATKGSAGP